MANRSSGKLDAKKQSRGQSVRTSPRQNHRAQRIWTPSLQNWKPLSKQSKKKIKTNVSLDCGWGQLHFAHTYEGPQKLISDLVKETPGQRDIAFYVRDPHVALSEAPQDVFLDPSHTFRLWFEKYRQPRQPTHHLNVRRIQKKADLEAANQVLASRRMVTFSEDYLWKNRNSRVFTLLIAEHLNTGEVVGFVMGVNHSHAFNDPEHGSSLWSLCVKRNCPLPGIGEALTRQLAESFIAANCSFMDLSVMHDNNEAIKLYEKLGFERVPVFTLKKRNSINESLYVPHVEESKLNPYAKIIFDEARRRDIGVKTLDGEKGLMELNWSGHVHLTMESLSDMTSSIAYLICQDKRWTHKWLRAFGHPVPRQIEWREDNLEECRAFYESHDKFVVKPAKGEQGKGVVVGLSRWNDIKKAATSLLKTEQEPVLEEFVSGQEVRVIVINFEIVAAALRKPAEVLGTGQHTVKQLVEKQSRRRQAETQGESKIPIDEVTEAVIKDAGYKWDSILEQGVCLQVRRNTNLHTGGTIHDITGQISPKIKSACEKAAKDLNIPVVGFDILCPDYKKGDFWILEANERPGLANHEPQPTAQKFIDLLFPRTAHSQKSLSRTTQRKS